MNIKKRSKEEILYNIKKLNNYCGKTTFTITKGRYDYTAIKKFGVRKLREFFDIYYSAILSNYLEDENI